MLELVEDVSNQGWIHVFGETMPMVFKNKVREFYYTMDFSEDVL